MLKTGNLDRKVAIERRVDTRDDFGQPIPAWSRIGAKRWAQKTAVSGTERFISAQFVAREQVEFVVRWAQDLADLNPLDRVVYPVLSGEPPDERIFEIMAVHEIGYHEGLRIMAARRSET